MNQVLYMDQTLDVGVDGYALVTTPLLNKGTAFTRGGTRPVRAARLPAAACGTPGGPGRHGG